MSWFSENYEKVSLGGAAVIALGLIFTGWQNLGLVEKDFNSRPKGIGNEDASVPKSDEVATALSSFKIKRELIQGDDNGRLVNLFIGVPLFVNKNDLKIPVDLRKSSDVHPPIPNQWWLENRIDPGFGDSPQRDEDEDGFSNIEEFKANSDPNDKHSHPNLIHKLLYIGNESLEWGIRPLYPSQEGKYTFEYRDTAGQKIKTGAANAVAKDGLFFADGAVKDRFKYLGFEQKIEINERIKTEVKVNYVKIEDQKPNKKGMIYEIPAFKNSDWGKHTKFDRTAILTLEAIDLNGQQFKIEEYTDFSLPVESDDKRFKLMEVNSERIIIRETLENGKPQDYEINKGLPGVTPK